MCWRMWKKHTLNTMCCNVTQSSLYSDRVLRAGKGLVKQLLAATGMTR